MNMKENLINKIKLMMSYDMGKTLIENKEVNNLVDEEELNEINPVTAADAAASCCASAADVSIPGVRTQRGVYSPQRQFWSGVPQHLVPTPEFLCQLGAAKGPIHRAICVIPCGGRLIL